MDRLDGAISSPPDDAFDFERVCRAGLSMSPSRVPGRSPSESDVTTVDDEATERERREDWLDGAPLAMRPVRVCFSLQSDAAEDDEAWGATRFLRARVKDLVMW